MSKAILSKEEAENFVVTFNPRRFPAAVSEAASGFIAFNSNQPHSSFKLDPLVAQQTGIADVERQSLEEKIEQEALVRLKDLQEEAYREAYALGLEEGREKAFNEVKEELGQRLSQLEQVLMSVESLKSDLIACNEAQLVQLMFFMAKRVILEDVKHNREMILEIIRQAIASAQTDEAVTVRVSPQDMEFIDSVREKLGKEFASLKQAKFEASPEVSMGGCIVLTNFGEVNATLEQRVEKLWTAVSEKLPKVSDTLTATPDDSSGHE